MHVRAGTNKYGVSLERNTTPPPSSWTAHAEKAYKYIKSVKRNLKLYGYYKKKVVKEKNRAPRSALVEQRQSRAEQS